MKSEDTIEEAFIPIWEKTNKEIHLALDFKENKAFLSQNLLYIHGEKEQEFLTLLTSEKESIVVNELDILGKYGLKAREMPNIIENRWSLGSIREFLNGNRFDITFRDVFNMVKEQLLYYIDLPDKNMYDFLSCWAIGTYFFPLFNTYPYVFLNATKRAGKTKILTLMSCICFNSKFALSLTPATLFRLIQGNRCTLLIDETETITNKELGDFRSMLLSGYKKGIKVPRAQEMRKKKAFSVQEFDVFSPKMLANINGIEDILEDRCVTLVVLRTKDKSLGNREIDINGDEWQKIRDKLYINLMNNWGELKKNYNILYDTFNLTHKKGVESVVSGVSVAEKRPNKKKTTIDVENDGFHINQRTTLNTYNTPFLHTTLPNNNNNNTTLTTLDDVSYYLRKKYGLFSDTLHTETTQTYMDIVEQFEMIRARDLELWLPILSIGLTVGDDVFNNVISMCMTNIREKEVENVTENVDNIIIETLKEIIDEDKYIDQSFLGYLSKRFIYLP